MRTVLMPLILAVFGLVAGAGAGWFLKPAPDVSEPNDKTMVLKDNGDADAASDQSGKSKSDDKSDASGEDSEGLSEFVKLNNQFVIPVVADRTVSSLVVMSLSLEVENGLRASVYEREPKLRDALLQVMFDHANIGGFDGAFTEANNLEILRRALPETARQVMTGPVFGVLIVDIARQDL